MNIKQFVLDLAKRYSTNNPYRIAENYSCIDIIKTPLGKEIRGLYLYHKRNRIIYINDSLDENVQRVVCAHELGHALMHVKINTVFLLNRTFLSTNLYEREANIFAAELLLPDEVYDEYKDFTYEQIAWSENLPIDLVKIKYEQSKKRL